MDKERREGNFLIKILSFPSFINIFVRLSSCAICKKMLKKRKKKKWNFNRWNDARPRNCELSWKNNQKNFSASTVEKQWSALSEWITNIFGWWYKLLHILRVWFAIFVMQLHLFARELILNLEIASISIFFFCLIYYTCIFN